jgi:hypothetical protein
MMSSACPLQRVSDTCSPCMFSGQDTGILSQGTHATHRTSLTHGCGSVPSCLLLPSWVGEGAFSCKPSLSHLGREPTLVRFPSWQGGEALGNACQCFAGPPHGAAHSLAGRQHLSFSWNGAGHTASAGTPLVQSADSSPWPCPGNVAPWLLRCGQKIKRRMGPAT